MAKVVVFGTEDFAQLAHYYLLHDSQHEVVGFTVDRAFCKTSTWMGLPVVPFEEVETFFPPSQFRMFVPMSPNRMNRIRQEKYEASLQKGYQLISYVSSKATVWAGVEIGENCFILEDNTIQPFSKIGNNVTLWSGNHIGHHSVIGDHCMLTSHVVISGHVTVQRNCFFGVNSTLRDGLVIGEFSFIAAGALVTKSTAARSVMKGPVAELQAKNSDHF